MVNGVLLWVYFAVRLVQLVWWSLNPLYVISSVLECVVGVDILSSCQNPHIGFLTCGVRAIMVWKAKCKPF